MLIIMAEYQLKPTLEIRRVGREEFYREAASLDTKGSLALAMASGNEYTIFLNENKPTAYAVSSENLSRISGLAVHQNYRGKGIGKKVVGHLKENARKDGKSLVICALPSTYEFFQDCGLTITEHEPMEVWLADRS